MTPHPRPNNRPIWYAAAALTVALPAAATPAAPGPPAGAIDALLRHDLIALFAVVAAGMLLGKITVAGLSLGTSGVLFVALGLGHFGYDLPAGIGSLGLVLFVYCVGVSAGSSFFRAFASQGKQLALMACAVVAAGALVTVGLGRLFEVPVGLAAGLFAGALTSTPALATAVEALGPAGAQASIGYGIAYPFGVVGVVLFVQLLPRLLRQDLDQLAAQLDRNRPAQRRIVRVLVEVANPALAGKRLTDIEFLSSARSAVSRVLEGQRLTPIGPEFTLEPDQHVLVVGEEDRVGFVVDFLGRRSDKPYVMDTDRERTQVVVTDRRMLGRPLRELALLKTYGVTVSRVTRYDVSFVPSAETALRVGDSLTAVGEPDNLARFAADAGHRAKAVDQTDIISLAVGITLGVVLGLIPVTLPGGRSLSLGLAGGPLVVALVLGHFGRVGRIVGHIPRPSRLLMMELGLVFFLADAGVRAGGSALEVIRAHGASLLLLGAAVTSASMLLGFIIAKQVLRLNMLETLGGVCGGMTSTPGIGAITSRTDADAPVVSYATAYPVALVLMTVAAQLIVSALA